MITTTLLRYTTKTSTRNCRHSSAPAAAPTCSRSHRTEVKTSVPAPAARPPHEAAFDAAIAAFKADPGTWLYCKVCEAARDYKDVCEKMREQEGEAGA